MTKRLERVMKIREIIRGETDTKLSLSAAARIDAWYRENYHEIEKQDLEQANGNDH